MDCRHLAKNYCLSAKHRSSSRVFRLFMNTSAFSNKKERLQNYAQLKKPTISGKQLKFCRFLKNWLHFWKFFENVLHSFLWQVQIRPCFKKTNSTAFCFSPKSFKNFLASIQRLNSKISISAILNNANCVPNWLTIRIPPKPLIDSRPKCIAILQFSIANNWLLARLENPCTRLFWNAKIMRIDGKKIKSVREDGQYCLDNKFWSEILHVQTNRIEIN